MSHGPIQEAYREKMNQLAEALDEFFNPDPNNKATCFTLLITRFGDEPNGRVNYISNGRRREIVEMLKELINRFEGGDQRKLSIDDIEMIMRSMSTSTSIKEKLK